ncbi:recombinase family protein [Carboxylicivirga sp. RSCT41]|uniref:recombinase family protein n=1 Tax=Carboxylicivirga agarovorans TaxID=3417570 RepID=UPI003D33F27A
MKSCVIYSRVSTEVQNNKSQIQDLRDYAKYMKFKILGVYEEKVSGTTNATERLAFKELMDYAKGGQVDNILIWELSRLGRNLKDILKTVDILTEKRINVYAKKENINTLNDDKSVNNTAQMLLGIMGSVAQYERTTITERSKRGLHYHLKSGGSFSLPPYGYKSESGKLCIDKNESEVVKDIYDYFINGMASPSIARRLNNDNIPTKKGVKWSDTQIREILHNSAYHGKRKYVFGVVDIPAIIDEVTYIRAKQIFDKNLNLNNDKAIFVNYLKGLVKCGKCGLSYYQHARASKRDFAYKCMSNRYKVTGQTSKVCGNYGININLLNSFVYLSIWSLLIEYSEKVTVGDVMIPKMKQNTIKVDSIKKDIKTFKKHINSSSKKLTKLTDLLLRSVIREDQYVEQKIAIEEAIDRDTKNLHDSMIVLEKLKSDSRSATYITGLGEYLEKMNKNGTQSVTNCHSMKTQEYETFIDTLITDIYIHGNNKDTCIMEQVPTIHHEKITKVVVRNIYKEYTYYTVKGIKQYSYELINGKLHKVSLVKDVMQ